MVGVVIFESLRYIAPNDASNPKYRGIRFQKLWSTDPKLSVGRLRITTDVAGWTVIKSLLSSTPKFKLNPRKLLVRYALVSASAFTASPKVGEKASRKVSELNRSTSATARQPCGSNASNETRVSLPPSGCNAPPGPGRPRSSTPKKFAVKFTFSQGVARTSSVWLQPRRLMNSAPTVASNHCVGAQ